MDEDNNSTYQASRYDRIWRENMQAALPGMIKKVLCIDVVHSLDLPDKLLLTKQREVDVLQRVTDSEGNSFVLHIEIQTRDDADMVYRMAEYSIMIERKYRLPVKQYVIYIGKGESKMKTVLKSLHLHFEYHLVSLSKFSYKLFLSSDLPEENMLGILGSFEGEDPEKVLSVILQKVQQSSKGALSEDRYFQQLRILIQLRNLAKQFDRAMEKITKFFKEEKDPFYQKGIRKGKEEGREEGREEGIVQGKSEVVRNLIVELGLSDDQTAKVAGVPVEFVRNIRTTLSGR